MSTRCSRIRLFVQLGLLCLVWSTSSLQASPRGGGGAVARSSSTSRKRFSTASPITDRIHYQQQQRRVWINKQEETTKKEGEITSKESDNGSTSSAVVTAVRATTSTLLSKKVVLVSLFGLLSGVTDVICQKRHRCYSNIMTGNMIHVCYSMVEGQWSSALKYSSLVISFLSGVILKKKLDGLVANDKTKKKNHVRSMATTPLVIVGLMGLAEVLYAASTSASSSQPPKSVGWGLPLVLLSIAGGMVNSCALKATDGTVIFALTGHLTKIANGLAEGSVPLVSLAMIASFCVGIAATTAIWNSIRQLPLMGMMGGIYGLALFGLSWSSMKNRDMTSIAAKKKRLSTRTAPVATTTPEWLLQVRQTSAPLVKKFGTNPLAGSPLEQEEAEGQEVGVSQVRRAHEVA